MLRLLFVVGNVVRWWYYPYSGLYEVLPAVGGKYIQKEKFLHDILTERSGTHGRTHKPKSICSPTLGSIKRSKDMNQESCISV